MKQAEEHFPKRETEPNQSMNQKLLCTFIVATALLSSVLHAGEGTPWTFDVSLYCPAVGASAKVVVHGYPAEIDFGLGSDLTRHAWPYSDWRFTTSGLVQLGYRWLHMVYETGSGTSQFKYQMLN